MRREVFFALQAAFLLLIVFSLYLGHDQLSQISPSFLKPNHWIHVNATQASVSASASPTTTTNATTTVANPTATTPADNGELPRIRRHDIVPSVPDLTPVCVSSNTRRSLGRQPHCLCRRNHEPR